MKDLRIIVFFIIAQAVYQGSLWLLHANGIEGWLAIGLAFLIGMVFVVAALRIASRIGQKPKDR
jgi:hypothetical protein